MSAEVVFARGPDGSDGGVQGTTVGGSKPLHRFIKGQPKIIGIVLLVLGTPFIIVTITMMVDSFAHQYIWSILPRFLMGTMFIVCGILYILTEHNPTKKTVTISLALSIISILVTAWTVLLTLSYSGHLHYYIRYSMDEMDENEDESMWSTYYVEMGMSCEAISALHCFVGGIIFIVMSALAGAALRSTKSQAIVVMTAIPTATPSNQ